MSLAHEGTYFDFGVSLLHLVNRGARGFERRRVTSTKSDCENRSDMAEADLSGLPPICICTMSDCGDFHRACVVFDEVQHPIVAALR